MLRHDTCLQRRFLVGTLTVVEPKEISGETLPEVDIEEAYRALRLGKNLIVRRIDEDGVASALFIKGDAIDAMRLQTRGPSGDEGANI